jgi:lipopolysaccharide biosynthesis glycosyltransferase
LGFTGNELMKNVHVAFVSDTKYLNFLTIAGYSLLENFNVIDNLTIHLIHPEHENMGDVILAPLKSLHEKRKFSLITHPVNVDSFEKEWGSRHPVFFRLIISELCPDLDKIIYCDCDMIFIDDVAKLWMLDLDGKALGGCGDRVGLKVQASLNIPAEKYINGGLLVMDLKQWRAEKASTKMAELYKNSPSLFRYRDQDLVNYYFRQGGDRIKLLPPQWNMINASYRRMPVKGMYTPDEIFEAVKHPCIAHFTGHHKPWLFFKFTHHAYAPWFWHYALKAPIPMRLKIKFWLKRLFTGRFHDSRHEARPWNYKMVHLPGRKRHD